MMKLMCVSALVALFGVALVNGWTVDDHGKQVTCYYSSWAFYRPGAGKYEISDIDENLCTIVYYGFADLNNITWKVDILDPWFDLLPEDQDCIDMHPSDPERWCKYGGYRAFTARKNDRPGTKWMLSLGGWNAGSGDYSTCAADPLKRQTFIEDALRVVNEYGFDGIDLDWEYPADRLGSDPNDYNTYPILVQEFAEALHAQGYLFTAALAAGFDKVEKGYNVPEISKHYDYLNIMGYDYNGAWANYTGHNSPLYRRPEEYTPDSELYLFNLYDTIMFYHSKGLPKEKAILGVPTYGRGWTVAEGYENNPGIYCPAVKGNPYGPYSQQDGHYGFNEVMEAQMNTTLWNLPEANPGEWIVARDDCYEAPHMVNGPYWISYDDPQSITRKVEFMNHLDIAGAMIWSLETDDFDGINAPRYALLQAINDALYEGNTYNPNDRTCNPSPPCQDMPWTMAPTTTEAQTTTTEAQTTTTEAQTTTTEAQTTTDGVQTTTTTSPYTCSEADQLLPHPVSCHLYFRCMDLGNGELVEWCQSCHDMVFNPNGGGCVGEGEAYDQCLASADTMDCPAVNP